MPSRTSEPLLSHNRSTTTSGFIYSEFADDAEFLPLLADFVEQLPVKLEAIHRAVEHQEVAELIQVLHQLKGAAGGYGFPSISNVALMLMQAYQENDLTTAAQRLNELEDLCRRVRLQPD
ncbi:MAG: hypothetical protein KatS3mg111_1075 [Pirellulaceae bacterium]|nr:MAG: hypothetical protein KatS3mg111_1075 [Pirellulaceae bacterium]